MKTIWKTTIAFFMLLLGAKVAIANQYYRKGKYETKYAIVHFDTVNDVYDFGDNLSSGFLEFNKSTRDNPNLIIQRIDGAVEDVAAKLKIPNASKFKVDIVLVRNQNEIASIRRSYDSEAVSVMNTQAFYVPRINAIYMPVDSDVIVLRHELVHALQLMYQGNTNEETARKYQEG